MPRKLFASKLSLEQWEEVRRLRAGGASFRDLGEQFGLTAETIRARAHREGWSSPADAALKHTGPRRSKARLRLPAAAHVKRLSQGLYRLIELEMMMLELSMTKKLDASEQAAAGAPPPLMTKDEREGFATLIEHINLMTEIASAPASAVDGRRKSAANPELTALSDDIDPAALAAASEKDDLRREIADKLETLVPPPTGT